MLDVSEWQEGPPFEGEDSDESRMLNEMAETAKTYLRSHKWAPPIASMYLASGVGNVMALFLVRFSKAITSTNDVEVWVVVGDLPSAYFVIDNATNARDALDCYCNLMDDWVEAVIGGKSLVDVFPVQAAATVAHADALSGRIQFIRQKLLPDI